MKRFSKKRSAALAAALVTVIEKAGAVPLQDPRFPPDYEECKGEYMLATRAGDLRLTVFLNGTSAGAWVAGRFNEVDRATAEGFDCNPYSGKWNHHFFDDKDPESIADYLARQLQRTQ